ncbi:HAD-IIIA family hydrolase [Kineococcus sp. SYSU DK004]|uniref:HAD-IIIA family hydrolase n=1 Tax=Kineococcus sp. SYSU DK004 TaxID=3383125 RepID=UPI003D7D8C1A
MSGESAWSVVVPTVGRPSLDVLLRSLAAQEGPRPELVVVVDDRREHAPLEVAEEVRAALPLRVVRSGGRGPAAARNAGWRRTRTAWVAFVDDDVLLPAGWARALQDDLVAAAPGTGAVQGRIEVPLPAGRRPTDWERGTAGLAGAAWITADMAYRRAALEAVGGFDERFPRAFREDADLALRVLDAGWELVRGEHGAVHPVRPADDLASLRQQRGNADDVLMDALHGPGWRERAQAPLGRLPQHAATTAAALAAAGLLAARRPRAAALAGAVWLALTGEFAWRRIAPGPRDGAEVRRMLLTSAAIPPAAVWHRLRAQWRWRRGAPAWPPPLRAVLFDRDGTLVHDVPYNGDPELVEPVDGAAEAVLRVRAAGLATGVVTNQSGVARGLLTREDVDRVNARVGDLLGPFDTVQVCEDGPDEPSTHRKPQPGMVLDAARALGVLPAECALVGDIGADVEAALSAGARGVLVPTPVTREEEVRDAPEVAADLAGALALLLDGTGARAAGAGEGGA